jgi:dCTP deaminase
VCVLTKSAIEDCLLDGRVTVTPPPQKIGPNSVDLTLHPRLEVYQGIYDEDLGYYILDMRNPSPTRSFEIPEKGSVLRPGELYIGSTAEETYTPHHVPLVSGRSSIGRLGIHVHVTAGLGDVGFRGQWTLEIHVVKPVRVYAGVRIGQLWLFETSGDRSQYAGRYQNQVGPTASRFHEGED